MNPSPSSLFPALAATAALLLASAFPAAAAAGAETNVLARGKGFVVIQKDLDEAFINLRGTLASQGRQLQDAQRPAIEQQLVEKLALTQLLLSRATEDDRKKATAKATKLIADEKAKAKSPARFEAQVRAAGLSPEVFEKQLLERAVCEEVLDRELRPQLGITPDKVRAFYDQNLANFKQPERVRLQQVVLSFRSTTGAELSESDKAEKKVLANRILERARKGEDIGQLARDFSDDPSGRERSGEYVFPVGRMVPEFEVAISGLASNKLSDVIATPFGYHVVKVLQRLPGEQIPFDTVSTNLKSRLELEATQTLLPGYQKKLFEESKVEILGKKN